MVNVGLNDQDGTFTLYSNDPGSVVSSLYLCRTTGGATVRATEECRLTTLDEYCREQDIGRIDHLKLDVEGNEYKVLRGAARLLEAGAIEQVQFEFGEAQIDSRTFFRDLFELLAPSYNLYRVLRSGLRPIPRYNPILEVFRTTNYLAIRRQHSPEATRTS